MGERAEQAPESLRAHMTALVVAHPEWGALPVPEALVAAGESALARVIAAGDAAHARDTALDLLAADAFVTYAFEEAANDPGTVAGRAEKAMQRISKLLASKG